MSLAAAVSDALPLLRSEARALMTEVAVASTSQRVFEAGKWVVTTADADPIPAKLTRSKATTFRTVGEVEIPIGTPVLCTPYDAPRWPVGTSVRIVAGPNTGRRFTVTHVGDPTHMVQHRYAVEEVAT